MIERLLTNINLICDHVWAMVLVALGAALVVCNHKDVGELIVGGGLALFRGQQK